MYLQNSADVLNLSLAISVFGLAFILGWILVYFLLIIRRMVRILSGIEEAMGKVGNFVETAKEKLESSSSYLSIVAAGAKELIRYLIDRRATSTSEKPNKRKKSS